MSDCAHYRQHNDEYVTGCKAYCQKIRRTVCCIPVDKVYHKTKGTVEAMIKEAFRTLQNDYEGTDKIIDEQMIKFEVNRMIKKVYEYSKEYLNNREIKVKKEYSLE